MHIFIDTYGVSVDVDNGMIRFKSETDIRALSVKKIKSINCFKHVNITSAAMITASAHEIPIIFYNHYGRVEAWIWSHKYGNIADIRLNQAFYSISDEKLTWIKKLIDDKIKNQIANLSWLKNRKTKYQNEINKAIDIINTIKYDLPTKQHVSNLRAAEGIVSKHYWDVIFLCLQNHTDAIKRIKRGANDGFNSALNYVYGILYGQIESSLLMHGIDPYMGLMHINRHDRPALAFDHIEPFRPWIDRLLITLIIGGFDNDDHYEIGEDNHLLLSSAGRKILIESFFNLMEERSLLNGKRIRNKDHIHYLSNELVSILKNFKFQT